MQKTSTAELSMQGTLVPKVQEPATTIPCHESSHKDSLGSIRWWKLLKMLYEIRTLRKAMACSPD